MANEIDTIKSKELVTSYEIKNLIYTIRGKQVMIDSDVARQLTEKEVENLKFQFGTSSFKKKLWWKKISSICFYRTRNINVIRNFKK